MAFLHGVRVREVPGGTRPVREIDTAVIAIVGTAPIWQAAAADRKVNDAVLVLSDVDAARYFGQDTAGYTIPSALRAVQDHGAGLVVVINVFDPAVHKTAVAAANYTFDAKDVITLPHQGVRAVVVKSTDGLTTYAEGTAYTLDAVKGIITRKAGGGLAAGATVSVAYDRPDPTLVTNAQVIGTVDAAGNRTGLQALRGVPSKFGIEPGVVIAPGFSTQTAVATELDVLARVLEAVALIDAPVGLTFAQALASRSAAGSNFNTGSDRVMLLYPHLQRTDASDAQVLEPFSQRLAGVIAETDRRFGFWFSPSNKAIRGITGAERTLTARLDDPNNSTEVSQLNAAGITTVFNAFGAGIRVWGNYTAAYPSAPGAESFLAVRRIRDVVRKALRQSALPFIDLPINEALIDAIVETMNAYYRSKVAQGALLFGEATYNAAASDLASGLLVFRNTITPPPPAQGIVIEEALDFNLLRSLGAQSA